MQVSAREFRSNQGKFLTAAQRGQTLTLRSRYGRFRITPIYDDELTTRICEGLREVKQIEEGQLPSRTAYDFLNTTSQSILKWNCQL